MKTIRIIAYRRDINDNDLAIYAEGIYTKCNSNAAFASLTSTLTNLNTGITILGKALRAQKKGRFK